MNNKEYLISVDTFEGPLDLLHQLIEKRKLQINTISLSEITNDYMANIEKSSISIEEVARFMYIASILILIKSKSLLPILEYTEEEKVDVEVLEDKMKLFEYIKKFVIPKLDKWEKISYIISTPKKEVVRSFSPDKSCNTNNIKENVLNIVSDLSFFKTPPKKTIQKTILIEEVIEKVLKNVTEKITVSFKSMSKSSNKQEKIVSFLAILELVRNNLLNAIQNGKFEDILISKKKS